MAVKDSKRSIRLAQPSAADSTKTKSTKTRRSRAGKSAGRTPGYANRRSHRFEEVRGKTVDFVEVFTCGGFHCLDVRFQDRTSLTLEIEPTFVVEPYHSDWKTGNLRPLRSWPLIHSQRL